MNQELRLKYLIDYLCAESDEYKGGEIEQFDMESGFRALLNIRKPKPVSEEFLRIQNEYLQEKAREKGIVTLKEIPSLFDEGYKGMLTDKMSIWQGDITRLAVDGIVNAANSQMLGCFRPGHKCIDNAIHSAAGIQLREECHRYMKWRRRERLQYEEPTGSAVLTNGYNLPAKYILHTVGPIVSGNLSGIHRRALRNCYYSCLKKALESEMKSIAFCCISTGEFHYPNEDAATVAVRTVQGFLKEYSQYFERVIFNVYKHEDHQIYRKILAEYEVEEVES